MLIADKILSDDEAECNIEITSEELEKAANRDPVMRYPVLSARTVYDGKISVGVPAYWYEDTEDYDGYFYYDNIYDEEDADTLWNTSYVDIFREEYTVDTIDEEYNDFMEYLEDEYGAEKIDTIGATGYVALDYDEEDGYYSEIFITRDKDSIYYVTVGYHENFADIAEPLAKEVIDSVKINNK